MDPLKPSAALLCKLGSIAVHAEEMLSPTRHHFDKLELEQRLQDPELQEWLKAMDAMAMIPKKRTFQDQTLALARDITQSRAKQKKRK